MSLKARIEAVIYAAEEPVSLAQLAALFGDEALEQKQAREEALAAESANLAEADAQEAEEVTAVPAPGHSAESAEAAENKSENAQPAEDTSSTGDSLQPSPEEESSAPTAAPESTEGAETEAPVSQPEAETEELSPETAAAEEKRLARQRDREIRDEIRATLDELIADYENSSRGMEVREVAGGYRVGTKPEYHDSVRAFVKSLKPPIKLTLQALETLAVIAYKQPITVPEISEIRGVDSAGVIGSLISRKLVSTAGRKQVIGRPILYKTTKEFLLRFGLKNLNDLPSMEEFEKMAGELADNDAEEPAENENLPFASGEDVEADSADGEAGAEDEADYDDSPVTTAEELASRAEHGSPGASTPLAIEVTVESAAEIEEDLPGVEVTIEALEAESDAVAIEEPAAEPITGAAIKEPAQS